MMTSCSGLQICVYEGARPGGHRRVSSHVHSYLRVPEEAPGAGAGRLLAQYPWPELGRTTCGTVKGLMPSCVTTAGGRNYFGKVSYPPKG